jgi:hypothetical protein
MNFLANYSTTLFEKRYPLASFDSCSEDPSAPRPAVTWARTFGRKGSLGESVQSVLQVSDGGYFVVGDSSLFDGVTGFAASAWALRLDALGNVIWQRAYERGPQGLVRAAVEVPGGFLIAGTSGLVKVDTGGNVIWANDYTAADELDIVSATADPAGGVVVAGSLSVAGKAWAMKVDDDGGVVWSQSFAGDGFSRVRSTRDGGTVLSGTISLSKAGPVGRPALPRSCCLTGVGP